MQGLSSSETIARYKFDLAIENVTGASISSNGDKILILNYENAFEFEYDLASTRPPAQYSKIIPKSYRSPQQEAISYGPTDASFYVSSEQKKSPLRKYTCE